MQTQKLSLVLSIGLSLSLIACQVPELLNPEMSVSDSVPDTAPELVEGVESGTELEPNQPSPEASSDTGPPATLMPPEGNLSPELVSPAVEALPVYRVAGRGLSLTEAERLAQAMHLPEIPVDIYGMVDFTDAEFFQYVPTQTVEGTPDFNNEDGEATVREILNLKALESLAPLSEGEARKAVNNAMAEAGLNPGSGVVGFTEFSAVSASYSPIVAAKLDTHVDYPQALNGYPLIGPGSRKKVVVDPEGRVTRLVYAHYDLEAGPPQTIISPEAAQALARQRLLGAGAVNAENISFLTTELVYYAPPLQANTVTEIFPHYRIEAQLKQSGEEVPVKFMLIPAVENRPQVDFNLRYENGLVHAEAVITGGTPPYQLLWQSQTSSLSPDIPRTQKEIVYKPNPRLPNGKEQLGIMVSDANHLVNQAQKSVALNEGAFATAAEIGVSWLGLSVGLSLSASNAGGLMQQFQRYDIPIQFNWADYNAWESDFVTDNQDGHDGDYADDVDLAFFTGHATGTGLDFISQQNDQKFHRSEAELGDGDLEWLVVSACGPLQPQALGNSVYERWGPAFHGLHQILGYATTSYENNREGLTFAANILDLDLKVRQAWSSMAIAAQSHTVLHGTMGVIAPDGTSNINDHFWGHGNVGPDIPFSEDNGYWAIISPS